MPDNSNDARRELFDRFITETRDNPQTAFFSEEELIDLFDFANDYDNDFIRCEVLLFGASRYPESDELRVRRGFQYFYQGVDVRLIRQVLAQVDHANTLGRILAVRIADITSTQSVTQGLAEIIDSVSEFAEEEVIQLIDLAADASALDWLVARKDAIIDRCSYKPTPLYEFGDVLYEAGRFAEAAEAFDELTRLAPFNIDFWNRLTEAVASDGDYERARESADFALAIDPDDATARILKARVLFALEKDHHEIATLLEPLVLERLKEPVPDVLPVQIYASVLSYLDATPTRAIEILEKAADILPSNRNILMGLAVTNAPKLEQRVAAYIEAADSLDSLSIVELTDKLIEVNPSLLPLCAKVAHAFFHDRPTDPLATHMFTLLYRAKRYADVIQLFDTFDAILRPDGPVFPEKIDGVTTQPSVMIANVFSRLRTAKTDDERNQAIITLVRAAARPPVASNIEQSIAIEGMVSILNPVIHYINDHRSSAAPRLTASTHTPDNQKRIISPIRLIDLPPRKKPPPARIKSGRGVSVKVKRRLKISVMNGRIIS